jgi:hypothetical protein
MKSSAVFLGSSSLWNVMKLHNSASDRIYARHTDTVTPRHPAPWVRKLKKEQT